MKPILVILITRLHQIIPQLVCVSGVVALIGCATPTQQPSPETSKAECSPLPLKSERAALERLGPNLFQVKCDQVQQVAVQQKRDFWCWAACAEMLHRYYGSDLTQEDIAIWLGKQTESGGEAEAAGKLEIWLAMNPDLKLEMDRRQASWRQSDKPNTVSVGRHANFVNLGDVLTSLTDPSADTIIQELSSGNPLVLGLRGADGGGHVVIVHGAQYSRVNPKGEARYRDLNAVLFRFQRHYTIHKLQIIDPQPLEGQSMVQEIDGNAFTSQKTFVIGKDDARKQLEAYMKVWMPTPTEMKGK